MVGHARPLLRQQGPNLRHAHAFNGVLPVFRTAGSGTKLGSAGLEAPQCGAEYYLHGLYGAAAKDWSHVGPTLTAPVYNAIKWVALRCKDAGRPELEAWLRTNPSNPISEPDGSVWALRGLEDGWPIDGATEVIARAAGHGLSLPALNAVAPCKSISRGAVAGQRTIQPRWQFLFATSRDHYNVDFHRAQW